MHTQFPQPRVCMFLRLDSHQVPHLLTVIWFFHFLSTTCDLHIKHFSMSAIWLRFMCFEFQKCPHFSLFHENKPKSSHFTRLFSSVNSVSLANGYRTFKIKPKTTSHILRSPIERQLPQSPFQSRRNTATSSSQISNPSHRHSNKTR